MTKIVILSFLMCLFVQDARAGYWTKQFDSIALLHTVSPTAAHKSVQQNDHKRPFKHKRKGIAILLAALAVFPYTAFLGCGGLHRAYMGYGEAWSTQLAGSLSALVGGTVLLFLVIVLHITTGLAFYGMAALLAFGAITYLWQWLDLIRIISGDLQPKNGKWHENKKKKPDGNGKQWEDE